tara:strand:- start:7203 stop:7772 length:570 start_codon:yes stop_codon:yes gene_type:complete
MVDIFAEMEADAIANASNIATDEQLSGVAKLVHQQLQIEEAIASTEDHLKALKKDHQRISTQTIPDAITDANLLSEFTTADGIKVSIKPFISANISEARREEAHFWLREHEHGDIIKNIISVDTGKDQKLAEQAITALSEGGFNPSSKESVHASTLKAWLREQVEAGTPVPLELFGAFLGQKSTIKRIT